MKRILHRLKPTTHHPINSDEEEQVIDNSCSSSEDISSSQHSSTESSSSILAQLSLVCRSEQFHYYDAVRSATYTKSELVNGALRWQNYFRFKHQSDPLSLSLELCQRAQFWANHLAHTDTFYYSPHCDDVGQNMISKWSYDSTTDPEAEEIVKYWYSFVTYYHYNLDERILHTQASHFTQLVWRESTHFGIGKARSRSGKLIIVAYYHPPGNIRHRFRANVLPPLTAREKYLASTPQLPRVNSTSSLESIPSFSTA